MSYETQEFEDLIKKIEVNITTAYEQAAAEIKKRDTIINDLITSLAETTGVIEGTIKWLDNTRLPPCIPMQNIVDRANAVMAKAIKKEGGEG